MIRRIAAAAGVLLLVTLFLPWYGGKVEEAVRPTDVPEGRYTAVTTIIGDTSGWAYLGITDILVALGAAAIVALALLARDRRALWAGAGIALAVAGLIAFRAVITPPPPFSVASLDLGVPPSADTSEVDNQRTGPARRYGIFVAFLAAITAAGAAALAARRHPARD